MGYLSTTRTVTSNKVSGDSFPKSITDGLSVTNLREYTLSSEADFTCFVSLSSEKKVSSTVS